MTNLEYFYRQTSDMTYVSKTVPCLYKQHQCIVDSILVSNYNKK